MLATATFAPRSLLLLLLTAAPASTLTTGGKGPAAPRQLPALPTLWAPIDLARFLHHNKMESAATTVMESVRIGAFDEIDGPAFIDGDQFELAKRLGIPVATVLELKGALRSGEKDAYTKRMDRARDSTTRRPRELGWGWAASTGGVAGSETAGSKGASSSGLVDAELVADRIAGSLWGIFIGDALAMPAHWYYDVEALAKDYGRIEGYVPPQDKHATNYIMNVQWKQNKHRVKDLIGHHIHFGNGPHGPTRAVDIMRNWEEPNRHYHAGMSAGENTFNAHTARVLLRSIIKADGKYDKDLFTQDYINFMSVSGSHNDSYAEAIHRQWAANYFLDKKPPAECTGDENHDTPSIGGFVMLPPLITSVVAHGEANALTDMDDHLQITHKSKRLSAAARLYARTIMRVLAGESLSTAAGESGGDLGLDLVAIIKARLHDTDVANGEFGGACYIGDSLPVVLYLSTKYGVNATASIGKGDNTKDLGKNGFQRRQQEQLAKTAFKDALLANVNAGGENCHRGSALGALMGAAVGLRNIPMDLVDGLLKTEEIADEIEAVVALYTGVKGVRPGGSTLKVKGKPAGASAGKAEL